MQRYSNRHNIPLSLAVWLAHDSYDRVIDPKYFSATDFNRPLKQIVLPRQRTPEQKQTAQLEDVSELVASRIGHGIHDSIENVWLSKYEIALQNLGYPQKVIDRIVINPMLGEDLPKDAIPVYLEVRRFKEFMGFKIGGKFDFLAEGKLEDFKTTKVFGYKKGSNDQDYIQQASVYRWLNQDLVTSEKFRINYIFTDWLKSKIKQDPTYPKQQVLGKDYNLLSIEATEAFLATRLQEYIEYKDAPESDLPRCTDEELWRGAAVYKYFSNPAKLTRATKNFDNHNDAIAHMMSKGNKGIIQEHKGKVIRCNYCPAFQDCKQKDEYIANGTLEPFEDKIIAHTS